MRLDHKRDEELRRRKGTAGRTLLQFFWLLISLVGAYLLASWLFDAGHLSYNFFYNELKLPRVVPDWAILVAITLVVMIIIQFTVMLGYMVGNREGRSRSGMPSGYSKDAAPFDSEHSQW